MVRECPFCLCPIVFAARDEVADLECPGCHAVSMPFAAARCLPLVQSATANAGSGSSRHTS